MTESNEVAKTYGYCGIYCGACSVLVHGATGEEDGFISCCRSIPREALTCQGCRSGSLYPGCRICTIRACAIGKGVLHCTACPEYPCAEYSNWLKGARFLPHIREVRDGLEQIRREGADAWFALQKERWSCPACGARFSWYAGSCRECGVSLRGRAHTMQGLRRLLCRFLFPMLYRKALSVEKSRSAVRG